LKVVAQPQGHRRFVSGEDDAIVLLSPDSECIIGSPRWRAPDVSDRDEIDALSGGGTPSFHDIGEVQMIFVEQKLE
jgi:hypothetical protein